MQHEREGWRSFYFRIRQKLDKDVNFRDIAERYELAGGALLNVARYAAIRAIKTARPHNTKMTVLPGSAEN